MATTAKIIMLLISFFWKIKCFLVILKLSCCTANEGPVRIQMSGSYLCIPNNETVEPPYFQNRITMLYCPIPTLIYLWEIYIFLGCVCLFCCGQICELILGIYKSLTYRHMNVEIGTEAAQFPEKESINGMFVAVCSKYLFSSLRCTLVVSYDMISVDYHFCLWLAKKPILG